MDEIWEKAVEMALAGEKEPAAARVLTLDGAVKCIQGHLPRPELLEKYQNLEHLSIANIGVSSLEQFPRLGKLQKLVLSDNRIAGGLEFLVQAGLGSLRDLDLSNNRIHLIEDLVPLAELKLVSLDLYECPVTKMKDYRSRVFGLVKSLKYLDKMDAEENERPESEDEDEDDEEDDDEEDEEDPGSCEIDGEERTNGMRNGHSGRLEEVLEVDEEESEADEEETETGRQSNGVSEHPNGFRDENLNMDGEESDDSDEEDAYEEDGPLIGDDSQDSDDGDEDEDEEQVDNDEGRLRVSPRDIFHGETGMQPNGVSDDANGFQHVLVNLEDDSDGEDEYEDNGLLVNDTEDMDEEDDGLIVLNTEDLDEEDGDDDEELSNDVGDLGLPQRNGVLRNMMIEEIDGHEQGEDDGESSEDDGVEDGEEEDEEYVAELLARPVAEAIEVDEEGEGEEDYSDDDEVHVVYPVASSHLKRKRDDDDDGSDSVSDSSDNNDDDASSSDDADGDGDDE